MILLDTHIWIWHVNDPSLIPESLALRMSAEPLAISIISAWEVAQLNAKGRLSLDEPCLEWIENSLFNFRLSLIHLNTEIVVLANNLPGDLHRDPADRIIVATAIHHNLEVATIDQKILDYPHVRTIR